MRRACSLLIGLGLLGAALGCGHTIQYTAGACDCYPPPVESVLVPAGRTVPQPPPNGHIAPVAAPTTPPVGEPLPPPRENTEPSK